jgi:hypothetical protein
MDTGKVLFLRGLLVVFSLLLWVLLWQLWQLVITHLTLAVLVP